MVFNKLCGINMRRERWRDCSIMENIGRLCNKKATLLSIALPCACKSQNLCPHCGQSNRPIFMECLHNEVAKLMRQVHRIPCKKLCKFALRASRGNLDSVYISIVFIHRLYITIKLCTLKKAKTLNILLECVGIIKEFSHSLYKWRIVSYSRSKI